MPARATSGGYWSSLLAWKRALSSLIGGLIGIALLIALASAVGWTLTWLGWSPGQAETVDG